MAEVVTENGAIMLLDEKHIDVLTFSFPGRPRRWSILQSDGMVNVFFQATINFNGFSMVLIPLDHHH